MNTKEFIEKIKGIAVKFLEETPPPAPVELMEATTTDNQVLKATSWEVGQDITLVGVDGETPAPDGSYDLTGEPARTIVVKDGKIADVIEVVASVDPVMPEGFSEAFKKASTKFATGTAEERLANLEIVCKALGEYNFGWEIREQKNKSEREQAILVLTTKLSSVESANTVLISENKKLSEGMQGLLTALSEMEQPAPAPAPSPTEPKKHWEKFIPQN